MEAQLGWERAPMSRVIPRLGAAPAWATESYFPIVVGACERALPNCRCRCRCRCLSASGAVDKAAGGLAAVVGYGEHSLQAGERDENSGSQIHLQARMPVGRDGACPLGSSRSRGVRDQREAEGVSREAQRG